MARPQNVLDAIERRIPGLIISCVDDSPLVDEHGAEIPAYVVRFDNGVVGVVYEDEIDKICAC